MSRHTKLDKPLSRAVTDKCPGHDDIELVVYLEPGGLVKLVAEPTERRLKRNEVLPTVELNLQDYFTENFSSEPAADAGDDSYDVSLPDKSLELRVRRVLDKVAISYPHTDKLWYNAKVVLLNAIREEFNMPYGNKSRS